MPITLQKLLSLIPADTEQRVDQLRKRINTQIRDAIRRETGLTLNRQRERQQETHVENIAVPVILIAGLPESLKKVEYDDSQIIKILLSPYRRSIKNAKDNLDRLQPVLKLLQLNPLGKAFLLNRKSSVDDTSALLTEFLKLLEEKSPVDKILEVNEDVLGAYRYSINKRPNETLTFQFDSKRDDKSAGTIELYWGVIGLVAGMLGVEIEALTAVVLIHEIGHAYTHLGADIDGKRWSTSGFSHSETELKEGLAQYYTHIVSSRIENQLEGTFAAYDELLKHQPPPYHTHEEIVKDFRSEEVRLALLEIRRHGKSTLCDFIEALKQARERLRKAEVMSS